MKRSWLKTGSNSNSLCLLSGKYAEEKSTPSITLDLFILFYIEMKFVDLIKTVSNSFSNSFFQFLPFIYSVKNILWFFFSNDCCSLVRSSLTLSIWQLVQKFVIKVTDLIKILSYLWKQHFNCTESFSKTVTPLFYKSDTRDPS